MKRREEETKKRERKERRKEEGRQANIHIREEEVKLSLFEDGMVVYIENVMKSAKKLLELISRFSKVEGSKGDMPK